MTRPVAVIGLPLSIDNDVFVDEDFELDIAQKGGRGSGHWEHAGRPGKRGGSLPYKQSGIPTVNPRDYLGEVTRESVDKDNCRKVFNKFANDYLIMTPDAIDQFFKRNYEDNPEAMLGFVQAFADLDAKLPGIVFSGEDRIRINFYDTFGAFQPGADIVTETNRDTLFLLDGGEAVEVKHSREVKETIRDIDKKLVSAQADIEKYNDELKDPNSPTALFPEYFNYRINELKKEVVRLKRMKIFLETNGERYFDETPHLDHSIELFPRGRMLDAIVRHEMGHRMEQRIIRLLYSLAEPREIKAAYKRFSDSFTDNVLKNRKRKFPTRRSRDDANEYFAENFTLWSIGKTELCTPEFLSLMKQVVNGGHWFVEMDKQYLKTQMPYQYRPSR